MTMTTFVMVILLQVQSFIGKKLDAVAVPFPTFAQMLVSPHNNLRRIVPPKEWRHLHDAVAAL